MRQLYNKLLRSSEIPIIETTEIHSKGLYLSEQSKKVIYIKKSLNIKEKLKVLLHEYSHYIHLTHYFNNETRAECEMIANGSGFLVPVENGLNINKNVDLSKFTDDVDTVTRLETVIQTVGKHIIDGIVGINGINGIDGIDGIDGTDGRE